MGNARLDDGFSTKISFSSNGSVHVWEREVQPPGFTGGGPTNVSTMRNTRFETQSPKVLIGISDMNLQVAFAASAYGEILAMQQVNQLITATLPKGETVTVWGWIEKFTPPSHKKGDVPVAAMLIHISNHDNASPPNEVGPAFG